MNITADEVRSTSTVATSKLGQMGFLNGKIYRYIKAGAAELDPGKVCVAPTVVANHINLAPAAAYAAGAKTVTLTLGATAATADQYAGGLMVVQDGAGEGINYYIEGNTAADASGVVTIYLREKIEVALAVATTECDLLVNKYNGAVIAVTDQADEAIGVPNVTIALSTYGWVQSGGDCSVLADETLTVGGEVTIGTSVAGAVENLDAAGEQVVGVVAGTAGVDTEYQNVNLKIDSGFAA